MLVHGPSLKGVAALGKGVAASITLNGVTYFLLSDDDTGEILRDDDTGEPLYDEAG